ncbi:tRNA dimethylallyltransferase [Fundidesulfovibrio magnetotacticus]|uniref:tRNA dimethylallyltransferase n=1 Tax=Fundidesulfovibrio magnetotacticus TaxID=2730080 RepID=A0A6V8LPU7_9BACT|nr:tRNA (adenosine(37)-N6)-dimethylallyltransferase MiaA [Fundidesulfovibrio magnetotacticus]GFK94573.1 tRNA dimethylallyltransferase [Fundidesulfovibrio magnetotacticus]
MSPSPARVLCVLGATGTGKTDAALALAEALGGAVVNVDSRQVYRGVPVTTAQPTQDEQARCPHHLYGFLPLEESVSAGAYAQQASGAVRQVLAQGLVPILTGGTGLYFQALLEGLAPIPDVPEAVRAAVQERWDHEGPETMHALLRRADPAYAAKVHANDRQRVTRALEVLEATGRTFSAWHARLERPMELDSFRLGVRVARPDLERRLARRIEAMLAAGAVEEIRAVLDSGVDPQAPGLSGIGCAELRDHLLGRTDLVEACRLWLANTRAYAKRQETWFRRDPHVRWFVPGDSAALVSHARSWLERDRPGAGEGAG